MRSDHGAKFARLGAGVGENVLRSIFSVNPSSAGRGVHRHWQEGDGAALLNADRRTLETTLESDPRRRFTDGCVFTLNAAPDSVYGAGCHYNFDAYAIVTTAEKFSDWTFEVHNIEAPKW